MFKCEVQCDLGLAPSWPLLGFKLPDDRYEVHLRNLEMTPGVQVPLMEVFLIFDSEHEEDDYKGAIAHAEAQLEHVLSVMTLAAGTRLQINRRVCIVDWRTGVSERKGAVFTGHGNPDLPQTILDINFAQSTHLLLHSKGNSAVDRALHWFSSAIAASHPDEQFEYFWFVVETLAVAFRDVTKVADLCAVCREPLHCHKCGGPSVHRPYPKQSISQLIDRFASKCQLDGSTIFEKGNALRNALQHGEDVAAVEERLGTTVNTLVDWLGRIARLALVDAFAKISTLRGTYNFRGIEPSTFIHYRLQSTHVVGIPCDPEKPPMLDDFPPRGFKVDLIITDPDDSGP